MFATYVSDVQVTWNLVKWNLHEFLNLKIYIYHFWLQIFADVSMNVIKPRDMAFWLYISEKRVYDFNRIIDLPQ